MQWGARVKWLHRMRAESLTGMSKKATPSPPSKKASVSPGTNSSFTAGTPTRLNACTEPLHPIIPPGHLFPVYNCKAETCYNCNVEPCLKLISLTNCKVSSA